MVSKDITYMEFTNLCRVCIKEKSRLLPIFNVMGGKYKNVYIAEILREISKYPVQKNDEFPQQLCIKCYEFVTNVYKFKKLLEKSHETLVEIRAQMNVREPQIKVQKTLRNEENALTFIECMDIEKVNVDFMAQDIELEEEDVLSGLDVIPNNMNKTSEEELQKYDYNVVDNEIEEENEVLLSSELDRNEKVDPDEYLLRVLEEDNEISDDEEEISKEVAEEEAEQSAEVVEDDNKSTEFVCEICKTSFKRLFYLKNHMYIHRTDNSLKCKYCSKSFKRIDHMKKHVKAAHSCIINKCNVCYRVFTSMNGLKCHIKEEHNNDPNARKIFVCTHCSKAFTTSSYLLKHELTHLQISCKRCKMNFSDEMELKEHENLSTCVEKSFLCFICGESFNRADYVNIHMRRHTGEKPYQCEYCEKRFPRSSDLRMHERSHTNNKMNNCKVCGKKFHRAHTLTVHMRTHTGERPYQCTECPKSFAQRSDLKGHLRRHTGERYNCDKCNDNFLHLFHLRNHYLNVHGIHMSKPTSRLRKMTLMKEDN